MATETPFSITPAVGKLLIRFDRVYGNLTMYPACQTGELFAKLTRKKTLSLSDLTTIRLLGFEVEFTQGSAAVLNSELPAPYVSPEMISVGVQLLRESGALASELSADYVLVRRLLETVLHVHERGQKS